MHQFIGDLLTSGNASKDQPDVLGAVWGVPAGDDALGFKGASLELLQPSIRPIIRDKPETEPLRRNQSGGLQRKEEARDKREGQSPLRDPAFSVQCLGTSLVLKVQCLIFGLICNVYIGKSLIHCL